MRSPGDPSILLISVRSAKSFRALLPLLLVLLSAFGCSQSLQPEKPGQDSAKNATRENEPSERYDLERDEHRGGHTLARHVARTDEQLRDRLARERNISAASTWTDSEIAEEVVAQALEAQETRISDWILRGHPRANLALHYDVRRVIGRSLRRGETSSVPCTSALIVLRADGLGSFYVLTAYPEARE